MPRPNHPTESEYERALDQAAHYRLECVRLRERLDEVMTEGRSLCLILSEDTDDYPDSSAYRQVMDRVKGLEDAIAKAREEA